MPVLDLHVGLDEVASIYQPVGPPVAELLQRCKLLDQNPTLNRICRRRFRDVVESASPSRLKLQCSGVNLDKVQ